MQTFCFAQNPDLFQTWRLTYISVELDSDIDVENISPQINTTITIDSDFNFEGDSGCNGYTGEFSYNESDDTLITQEFATTLLGCDIEVHQEIEDTYYSYLTELGSEPMSYEIDGDDNSKTLVISMLSPGFELFFTSNLLAIQPNIIVAFNIYPNPANNTIFIDTERNIEGITIYNTSGQKVATFKTKTIDTSQLTAGIYFIEVQTNGQKSLQRFIKQ